MPQKTADIFRANVRRRMRELGWTQLDLASALSISGPAISMMLSGKWQPTLDRVDEYAKALRVTPQWLLTQAEVESPAEASV